MNTYKIINASSWMSTCHQGTTITQYSPVSYALQSVFNFSEYLNPSIWRQHLRSFATVIVDQLTEEVLLVRDHFGFEPLYYSIYKKNLIFGSNIPDILKHLPEKPDWNKKTVMDLLTKNQRYSDETYYQNVFRVEPSSMLLFRQGKVTQKTFYWQLSPEQDAISLPTDRAYLEQFSDLLDKAVFASCADQSDQIAGELSGGVDSSAILTSATAQNFQFPLLMHIAPAGSLQNDDYDLASLLTKKLKHTDTYWVDAKDFEPLAVFEHCARLFAGPASNIFPMFSYNITSLVSKLGKKVLLSGAGGDECVSSHAPNSTLFPEIIKKEGFSKAWKFLIKHYYQEHKAPIATLKCAEKLLKHSHPLWFTLLSQAEDVHGWLKRYIMQKNERDNASKVNYFPSIRAFEWDRLQGPNSYSLRGRIEYSAVLARHLGFEYRYPLLNPDLVEFCFCLPYSQKFRKVEKRYLIRRYLENMGVPKPIWQKQQKLGGIIPATLEKCINLFDNKELQKEFVVQNKFSSLSGKTTHGSLINFVHQFMLSKVESGT